jgi:hypothetical protein
MVALFIHSLFSFLIQKGKQEQKHLLCMPPPPPASDAALPRRACPCSGPKDGYQIRTSCPVWDAQ